MVEASIGGFTVSVKKRFQRKLKKAKRIIVNYDSAKYEVAVDNISTAEKGMVRVGFRCLKDLTKPTPIKNSFLARIFEPSMTAQNVAVAYGGFVLVLFCVLAMPGLGDKLGTAPRIESAAKSMFLNITGTLEQWF